MTRTDPPAEPTRLEAAQRRLAQAARTFASNPTSRSGWIHLLAAKGDYDDAQEAVRQKRLPPFDCSLGLTTLAAAEAAYACALAHRAVYRASLSRSGPPYVVEARISRHLAANPEAVVASLRQAAEAADKSPPVAKVFTFGRDR